MSRFQSQLNTATRLIESYRHGEPFHLYLKQYFASNRKHGSSDRRLLRDLCYSYFRIGGLFSTRSISDRLLAAYYLVNEDPMAMIGALCPDWPAPTSNSPADRAALIGLSWVPEQIFPSIDQLSSGIDSVRFIESLLKQPDLFVRIRPGQEDLVQEKLTRDQIPHRYLGEHCLALSNATNLESRFSIDWEIVVQDLSSQRIAELFLELPTRNQWKVWDACAASGGKSMLAYDLLPQVQLTCTDLRPNILRNLHVRLQRAGIPVEKVGVDDLTKQQDRSEMGIFDLILADVPCTGSGTWSRTPEQLCSFDPGSISQFAKRQFTILKQLIQQLAPDGYLLYMTCSVFHEENDDVVSRICESHGMQLIKSQLFTGYLNRADSLYGALLKRST